MIEKNITSLSKSEGGSAVNAALQTARCLSLLLLFLIASILPIHGQRYMGAIAGEVSDSAGAKIVGATVTATDTITHFSTTAVTNGEGSYAIPFLTPDTYDVAVEASGFQRQVRAGIILTADTNAQADFTLSPGTQSESVTVKATSDNLIDKESADLQTTITKEMVTDLPNLGRVPFILGSLDPGLPFGLNSKVSTGLVPFGNNGTAFVANGVGGSHTAIMINGSTDAPHERISGSGAGYGGISPSPESVQQVNVQTAMYDAEYGNNGGVSINTVLRSGTDDYHGAAYYMLRNTYMNANTYERVATQNTTTPRANGTWNWGGGVIAGPVLIPRFYNGRSKTYFMIASEGMWMRTLETTSETGLVPTAAERTGDFSALCPGGFNSNGVCVSGGGITIYDPLTLNSGNNRTNFANNQIPQNRWNQAGVAIMNDYPLPNANVSAAENYVAPDPTTPNRYYSFTTRVDQSINDNNKFNAVFYKSYLHQQYPNMGYPTAIGPTSVDETVYRNNLGGSIDYISILSHGYVLDARTGVIFHPFLDVPAGDPFDLSSIGMNANGIYTQTFPGTTMSDSYAGLASGEGGQNSTDTEASADAIVSKTIATHYLRFGFQGNLDRYNGMTSMSGMGALTFNREFTQENSVNTSVGGSSSSGNAIAALLLGYPSSGTYTNSVSFAIQQPWYGFFLQDTWRAARSLTLNMGLRWENQMPYTERYNRLNTGFCTTCTNPLQSSVPSLTLLGGLEFASPSNREIYRKELSDWQPRFGASYQLNNQVVFHAGVGLTYINTTDGMYGNGWSTSTSYVATSDSTHPESSLSELFPGGTIAPSGSSQGLSTLIGQNLSFIDPNYVRPRLWQWSASVQNALPASISLQIAYVGNRVYDWENSKNINALPAQYETGTAANVTYLNTKVANPLAGLIGSGNTTLNASTVERQYLDLPYPEFGTLTETAVPSGGSLYNSLQVTVRRTGPVLTTVGSFGWFHEMDQNAYRNPFDANPERYLDPNPSMNGTIAVIYHLPRFSSRPFYVRDVIGGWQLNNVFRTNNGTAVGNPSGYIPLRSPSIPHPQHMKMFNTCWVNSSGQMVVTGTGTSSSTVTYTNYPACSSASDIPVFQQQNTYSIALQNPYMSHVRSQAAGNRWDASLFKVFHIHESVTFELQGEYFNVLNHPVFEAPYNTPNTSTFGEEGALQENDARIGEITGRINF